MPVMLVAEIEQGKNDSAGAPVRSVYAKRQPRYAVYRTDERVTIHYADDPTLEKSQRTVMAQLNPIRGEINGLIDGWRTDTISPLPSNATLYDRRVADALIAALEEDVAGASTLLAAIKSDIVDERTSWARFQYLIVASATVAVAILLVCFLVSDCFGSDAGALGIYVSLWVAAATGAVGAFFSIAIAIRTRTILTDLRLRDNSADAVLRVVIGAIAATLLVCLVQSNAVTFQIGNAKIGQPPAGVDWLFVLIVAFVGGFSERLVPDLLEKMANGSIQLAPPQLAAATGASAAGARLPSGPAGSPGRHERQSANGPGKRRG